MHLNYQEEVETQAPHSLGLPRHQGASPDIMGGAEKGHRPSPGCRWEVQVPFWVSWTSLQQGLGGVALYCQATVEVQAFHQAFGDWSWGACNFFLLVFFWRRVFIVKNISVLLGCLFPGPLARAGKLFLSLPPGVSVYGAFHHPVQDIYRKQKENPGSSLPCCLSPKVPSQSTFSPPSGLIQYNEFVLYCNVQGLQRYLGRRIGRNASIPSCPAMEIPTLSSRLRLQTKQKMQFSPQGVQSAAEEPGDTHYRSG